MLTLDLPGESGEPIQQRGLRFAVGAADGLREIRQFAFRTAEHYPRLTRRRQA